MVFIYDASGSPIGFQYRNEATYEPGVFVTYWYMKNMQGDIVAVCRDDGVIHVTYTYDAWGNVTTTYVNGGYDAAAYFNPFKYRGYYHDSETGFYYLNSRYYDPNTGRFINEDGLVSTGQGLLGYNMYAYCNNNPVNYCDHAGSNSEAILKGWSALMWWLHFVDGALPIGDIVYWSVTGVLVCVVVGGMIQGTTLNNSNNSNNSSPNTSHSNIYKSHISDIFYKESSIPAGIRIRVGRWEYGKCKEAANSAQKYLVKNGQHGSVITLTWPEMALRASQGRSTGYIWSDSKQCIVGDIGIHVGIMYDGIVYCNIHPTGLPKDQWINDFYAPEGSPIVTERPF